MVQGRVCRTVSWLEIRCHTSICARTFEKCWADEQNDVEPTVFVKVAIGPTLCIESSQHL